jgi:hypothetical protein
MSPTFGAMEAHLGARASGSHPDIADQRPAYPGLSSLGGCRLQRKGLTILWIPELLFQQLLA